jgi:hypothetical protein
MDEALQVRLSWELQELNEADVKAKAVRILDPRRTWGHDPESMPLAKACIARARALVLKRFKFNGRRMFLSGVSLACDGEIILEYEAFDDGRHDLSIDVGHDNAGQLGELLIYTAPDYSQSTPNIDELEFIQGSVVDGHFAQAKGTA